MVCLRVPPTLCFATMSSVPRPRNFPFSAARYRSTFYWGGATWDWAKGKYFPVTDLEYLYELEVVGYKWKKHPLKGQHPPGVYSGACAVVGDCLYLYGGKDKKGKLTGSLFELNLSTKSWRELSRPGTGGPKKKYLCGMVAYNSTLIIYGGKADDGATNELHMFDLKAGTWSSPHVTGDVPPPDWSFTFTKVSNHQVVLRGGWENMDTYVLDLSRMHWEKHHQPGHEEMEEHDLVAACLGLGSDHAQLLLLQPLRHAQLLDVATWKWMEMKLPDDVVIPLDNSATAIQTSPTTAEVVLYGNILLRLKFVKRPSAPEGVSPIQWWILTDYTSVLLEVGDMRGTELSKPTDPQTSSKTPENTSDNVDEGQGVSANMPDTISISSFEMRSEKTSNETDVVVVQAEDIDATVSGEPGFVDDVIEAVDQNQQIERRMANIILKGLPEAGKSSLLNRLLKRPFQKSYSSTGISDGIIVVDIQPSSTLTSATATSDNSSWEVIDFDASMYCQLKDSRQFLPSAEKWPVKGNSSIDTRSYQVHRVSSISEVPDNIKKVLSTHNITSIEDLKKKNSLYIRDTGGQVEFQESLTLLIYGPSIFIFVLRTDIDIHKRMIIRYRSPDGDICNEYESSISNHDALVQFLTSVSAINTSEKGQFYGKGVAHKPVVFIVGTHIDRLNEADFVIAKMNESLHKIIRVHGFSKVVRYFNAKASKVMYTVDNTSEDDHNFKILRSHVNFYIGERLEFKVVYPVGYLLFCLELQNITTAVISIGSFTKLASKFGIISNQISHLLHFLHFRIGIIQHYDVENLSDIVIKEPQILFSKVTDLLVKTFLSSEAALKMDEQTSFCQKGILEASVLESILGKNENDITSKQFLAFMVHLRLAVPFTDKNGVQKYFIPSVLNHVPSSSGGERKSDIAPLFICFQLGHCPQGLFGVFISHLLNPDESHEFSFDLSEDRIYQDQVSLLVNSSEDIDEISLQRHLSHIEITMYIEGCSDTVSETSSVPRVVTPTTVCTTVRSILQDCLQLSMKTLHYDINKLHPMFCLACPISNCHVKMHEVKTGKNACFMHCTIFKRKCEISLSGLYWFNGGNRNSTSSSRVSNTAEGLDSTLSQEVVVPTSVFSTKLSAEELADWLHSHHNLPEGACKILKDQSINGSVFEDLKKEDIDVLGFNFGAGKILLKVLEQIREHQTAQATCRTELNSNHYSEICRQLVSMKHQWEDIALALGFKDHEIEDIKRDVTLQVSGNQLYKVISFWLRWDPIDERGSKDIATLEALQEALNQTNNARIKLKITMNSAKQ